MLDNVFCYENDLTVSGLSKELIYEYINEYNNKYKKSIIVVCNSLYDANKIFKGIHNINNNVYFFPMDEFAMSTAISSSPDLKIIRIDTLNEIKKGSIIVTNLSGFLKRIDKKINRITINKKLKRKEIIDFLENNSYIKTNLVSTSGEYAVRNFIIDIFPINSDNPVRLEFFGDDIESIRIFDGETQISNKNIDEIMIYSFNDGITNNSDTILDKLVDPMVFFIDFKKIEDTYNDYKSQLSEFNLFKELNIKSVKNKIYINTFSDTAIIKNTKKYVSKDIDNFNKNYDKLYEYVIKNKDNYVVVFMIDNKILLNNIENIFKKDISYNTFIKGKVNIHNKGIECGYIFNNYIVISEHDIENTLKSSGFINHYNIGRKIKGYEDLNIGDYIVHVTHGIGRYQGLVTLETNGIKKDYLLLQYAGTDKVYIPAQKIETIYKYSDSDTEKPVLSSLSSNTWNKTKTKVREKIKDISKDLLNLYAKRETVVIDKFIETPEETLFNNDFEYEETKDQISAINDILKDLESTKPMDRLLCGDVGFGKTEVAMRAMFRTVMNNKQVAYLCPTTILSKQQYENAIKRFRYFPVNIELVNRFVSSKKISKIKEGIKRGTIDIVIGTHKLLNKEYDFKNLGLLIIDEEQRFGVTQKEKIKELKNNVNVLTLSATPIPRTLKLSMTGLKDMSLIDTPPINRYPIQTYVIEENDYILKDAIYKELARDGQIYLLVNNIDSLDSEYEKISKLVPEAKICVAHGRMEKNKLNSVITDFVEGLYNVLICTTIIETGIDIPNVNTLIIKNAEMFGLSQLYQIRGRVGRSDRIAYAYLMYNKKRMLNDAAIKRLQTIRDFTELGSGYKIAMRDLSIRGAGDLLGSSQSGFISSIGIDLYMDMITEEVNRLKGIEPNPIDLENNYLNVSTSVSKEYVDDESLRIEIHKMINNIKSEETFNKVKEEIEDRFGKITDDILNYMYEEWFNYLVSTMNINNIKYIGNNVNIELPVDISDKIDGEKLFFQIYTINNKFKISYKLKRLNISLNIINRKNEYVKDLLDMLLLVKECIKEN